MSLPPIDYDELWKAQIQLWAKLISSDLAMNNAGAQTLHVRPITLKKLKELLQQNFSAFAGFIFFFRLKNNVSMMDSKGTNFRLNELLETDSEISELLSIN